MTGPSPVIIAKLIELEDELKKMGLWQNETLDCINGLGKDSMVSEKDFVKWLQFVFLPNQSTHPQRNMLSNDKKTGMLRAIKFFGNEMKRGKLLQILIELDSLI